jgi:hypothetical protein
MEREAAMISTISWLAGVAVLATVGSGTGAPNVTRIVGSGDVVPESGGEVFLEVHSAQLAGAWVAARGYSVTEEGLYAWDQGVGRRVLHRFTQLPGLPAGGEILLSQGNYDIDATGRVVVAAAGFLPNHPDPTSTYRAGVWLWQDGDFEVLVLEGDTVSGSDQPFLAGGKPTIEDGRILFAASEGTPGDISLAIYQWTRDSGLERLFGPGFVSLAWPAADGGRLGFAGWSDTESGLWSAAFDGSDLRLELDFAGPYPGGPPGSTWQLISLGATPVITPPPLTFAARSSVDFGRHGLYRLRGEGVPELLYDGAGPDPTSGMAHIGIVPGLAGSGENVAFMLRDPTQVSTLGRRLIVRDGAGEYHLIAAEGRDFEGAPVGLIEFMHGAMDGDRLAFNVLRPGDGAVWIADFGAGAPSVLEVPTLETWALAALALGLLVAASRVLRCRVL